MPNRRNPGARPRCESGCGDTLSPELMREVDELRNDPKLKQAMKDPELRDALVDNPARVFKKIGFKPSARLARRLRRATNAKLRAEIKNPPEIRLGNGCTVKPKVRLRIVERLKQDGDD